MTQATDLLESIVQETVNTDEDPTDAHVEKWTALKVEEMSSHAWSYVERWLDALRYRDSGITAESLVALYISGFITGRLYEEQRDKRNTP